MKLVDLISVKQAMDKKDNQHDSILDLLIEGVSEQIEKILNRELLYGSRTDTLYNVKGITSYQVRAFPIDQSQPIAIDPDGMVLVEDVDYSIDYENGEITFFYPISARIFKVSYTGGYKEIGGVVQVPSALKQACVLQVIYEFQRRKDVGVVSVSTTGQGSYAYREGLSILRGVKELILPYRRFP